MKRTFTLALTICLSTFTSVSHAQKAFEEGQSSIQIGYGVGMYAEYAFLSYKNHTGYSYTPVGPMFAKYEYAVTSRLGFGINLAYIGADLKYSGTYYNHSNSQLETYNARVKWNTVSVLARMNFHFGNLKKFDPYCGVGLGYRTSSYKYEDDVDNDYYRDKFSFSNNIPLGFETTIGARYLFTNHIGIYAEAGIAKAALQFGANIKF